VTEHSAEFDVWCNVMPVNMKTARKWQSFEFCVWLLEKRTNFGRKLNPSNSSIASDLKAAANLFWNNLFEKP